MPDLDKVEVRGIVDRADQANPGFTIRDLKYHEVAAEVTPPLK